MQLKSTEVKKILKDPVKAAEIASLIYINEGQLSIKRHKQGRGFFYTKNDNKITCEKQITRFKSLVIPPAWKEVRISPLENGHLQVVGLDQKQRKQYRYHPDWNQIRNKTKFFKMNAFGKILPKIRAQVETDLKLPIMSKQKCLALVIALMEETHIRIGNQYYAKANKSYGLSTLRNKHLDISKNNLVFNFVGKKGKKHEVSLKNRRLQKLVLQCEEIPGWELFQYYDQDGNHHSIDSGMVNEYIHTLGGEIFSAKDFRTWSASKIFFETLASFETPENKTQIKENILLAYKITADALGNTKNVCKTHYVHPVLPSSYEDGKLDKKFKELQEDVGEEKHLSASERILLSIISKYKIELEDNK